MNVREAGLTSAEEIGSADVSEILIDHLNLWTSAVTTRSTAGRGRHGKIELTGIKKLRELILELAVRGKLVDQDPDDEPASVLLVRIAEEKARLVKEGKIKKPKKLPEITEEEKPFELPDGWQWARLAEIFDIQDHLRVPLNKSEREARKGDYPYYGANGQVGTVDDYIYEGKRILIAEDGGFFSDPIRGVAYIADGKFWVNNHAHVICNLANTPEEFWVSYFNQLDWLPLVRGMTRAKLNQAVMQKIPLPVPSLSEQHRIVEKVDELMALCDRLEQQVGDQLEAHEVLVDTLLGSLFKPAEGSLSRSADAAEVAENWARIAEHFDTLFTTEASIEKLKQAILQLAVMGQLVEQDPDDESASVLLERIAEEKARLVKEGKVKKQKKSSGTQDKISQLPLPSQWSWANLGELVGVMDAGWSPACPSHPAESDAWGVLKTTAVQVMKYSEVENKKLPDNKPPKDQYEVRRGDILITRAGPKNRVGISCVVKETRPKLMISDKIIRFHLIEAGFSEEYICLCLNAGETYQYLETAKSGMAESQMNISQDKLKAAPIPLCPANEQHRIVEKVDELMALCDQLKARLGEAGEIRTHLAGAVVEKAVS
ncbi:restriction endonuclease subunit S [Halomonas sp. MA07-2]|uniref:restriction endonuclease subunit S n=1 Tax=Halomonas sp. MA07-2 TaxID=3440841 RepID=UPI003EEC68E3